MLPKRQKLTRNTFPKHTERKTRWNGVFLSIQFIRYTSPGSPHFAVVIPKKTIALATKRNSEKRLLYDLIRTKEKSFSIFGNTKFVITPQKSVKPPLLSDYIREIDQFLSIYGTSQKNIH